MVINHRVYKLAENISNIVCSYSLDDFLKSTVYLMLCINIFEK